MSPENDELYFWREQSQVKHVILENYLERFGIIIGKTWDGIFYVDGFSGPWNTVSDNFRDSSFAIALRQLRSAREVVRERFKKDLRIKCIFLESDPKAFQRLEEFSKSNDDGEIIALNSEFEESIPDLVRKVKDHQSGYFPFFLIDPTGWKGFSMDVIAPLIRLEPGEVLINFMTSFINRFIRVEQAGIEASFQKLFGNDIFKACIEGLEGRAREDAIVFAYADRVGEVGRFPYVATTVILHPTKDKAHFHLVYATRHLKGIEVFKNAERKALRLSESLRADARRRARESASGQIEFFDGSALPEIGYLAELQVHYERLALRAISDLLQEKKGELPYDQVYATALRFPMVQEKFLKKWLKENTELINLGNQKTLTTGQGHYVRLREVT